MISKDILKNFYFRYCGAYIAINVILTLLLVGGLLLRNSQGMTVFWVAVVAASSFYPAYLFVKDNKRMPLKREQIRYTLILMLLSPIFVPLIQIISGFIVHEVTKNSNILIGGDNHSELLFFLIWAKSQSPAFLILITLLSLLWSEVSAYLLFSTLFYTFLYSCTLWLSFYGVAKLFLSRVDEKAEKGI